MGCCNEIVSNGSRVYHIKIDKNVAVTQDEIDKIKKDFIKAFDNAGINAQVEISRDCFYVERVL